MSNFIEASGNPHGAHLLGIVAAMEKTYTDLIILQAKLHSMSYGDTWGVVETEYGLPAGTGQTLVALVDNTITLLQGGGASAYMQMIGDFGI